MTDYSGTRRSIDLIEQIASEVLADPDCPKLDNGAIDILKALRMPKIKTIRGGKKILRLKLVADDLLPGKPAQMWGGNGRVTITARTTLWNRAEERGQEALEILRHEYSHGVLHSEENTKGRVSLNRQIGGNKVHDFIELERRLEDQADWLERCLAMPRNKISPTMDVRDLIADWNVTLSEAQWRLEQVRLASPKRLPDSIKRNIDAVGATGSIPLPAQSLWDKLPTAPNMSPALARMAEGYLVEYCQYKHCTHTGWIVEYGRIIPLITRLQI